MPRAHLAAWPCKLQIIVRAFGRGEHDGRNRLTGRIALGIPGRGRGILAFPDADGRPGGQLVVVGLVQARQQDNRIVLTPRRAVLVAARPPPVQVLLDLDSRHI